MDASLLRTRLWELLWFTVADSDTVSKAVGVGLTGLVAAPGKIDADEAEEMWGMGRSWFEADAEMEGGWCNGCVEEELT